MFCITDQFRFGSQKNAVSVRFWICQNQTAVLVSFICFTAQTLTNARQ